MLCYPLICEKPHISSMEAVRAMDCRSFLESLRFNELKCDDLTQLTILLDRRLGFLFAKIFIGERRAKTLMKLSISQKT